MKDLFHRTFNHFVSHKYYVILNTNYVILIICKVFQVMEHQAGLLQMNITENKI